MSSRGRGYPGRGYARGGANRRPYRGRGADTRRDWRGRGRKEFPVPRDHDHAPARGHPSERQQQKNDRGKDNSNYGDIDMRSEGIRVTVPNDRGLSIYDDLPEPQHKTEDSRPETAQPSVRDERRDDESIRITVGNERYLQDDFRLSDDVKNRLGSPVRNTSSDWLRSERSMRDDGSDRHSNDFVPERHHSQDRGRGFREDHRREYRSKERTPDFYDDDNNRRHGSSQGWQHAQRRDRRRDEPETWDDYGFQEKSRSRERSQDRESLRSRGSNGSRESRKPDQDHNRGDDDRKFRRSRSHQHSLSPPRKPAQSVDSSQQADIFEDAGKIKQKLDLSLLNPLSALAHKPEDKLFRSTDSSDIRSAVPSDPQDGGGSQAKDIDLEQGTFAALHGRAPSPDNSSIKVEDKLSDSPQLDSMNEPRGLTHVSTFASMDLDNIEDEDAFLYGDDSEPSEFRDSSVKRKTPPENDDFRIQDTGKRVSSNDFFDSPSYLQGGMTTTETKRSASSFESKERVGSHLQSRDFTDWDSLSSSQEKSPMFDTDRQLYVPEKLIFKQQLEKKKLFGTDRNLSPSLTGSSHSADARKMKNNQSSEFIMDIPPPSFRTLNLDLPSDVSTSVDVDDIPPPRTNISRVSEKLVDSISSKETSNRSIGNNSSGSGSKQKEVSVSGSEKGSDGNKEDTSSSYDPTIENILKSIGFNFELSKLSQEKAKKEREQSSEVTPDSYGVEQGSSFLPGGMKDIDRKSVFEVEKKPQAKRVADSKLAARSVETYEERAKRYRDEQMRLEHNKLPSPPARNIPDIEMKASLAQLQETYAEPGNRELVTSKSGQVLDRRINLDRKNNGNSPTVRRDSRSRTRSRSPDVRKKRKTRYSPENPKRKGSSPSRRQHSSRSRSRSYSPDQRRDKKSSRRSQSSQSKSRQSPPPSSENITVPQSAYNPVPGSMYTMAPGYPPEAHMSAPHMLAMGGIGPPMMPFDPRLHHYPYGPPPPHGFPSAPGPPPQQQQQQQQQQPADDEWEKRRQEFLRKLQEPRPKADATNAPAEKSSRRTVVLPGQKKEVVSQNSASASKQNDRQKSEGSSDRETELIKKEYFIRQKRLTALKHELADLKKQQNEMMRKRQRQKDGHKDPQLAANSKLQDEVCEQIKSLRRAVEEGAKRIEEKEKHTEKQRERAMQGASRSRTQSLSSLSVSDLSSDSSKSPSPRPRPAKFEAGKDLKNADRKDGKTKKEQKKKKKNLSDEKTEEPNKSRKNTKSEKTIDSKLKDSKGGVVYEYFDPGKHVCRKCVAFCSDMEEYLMHINTKEHKEKLEKDEINYEPKLIKTAGQSAKEASANTVRLPAKGIEFMLPVEAFHCRLCDVTCFTSLVASEHLKTEVHNEKYQAYIANFPQYEHQQGLMNKSALKNHPALSEQHHAVRRRPTHSRSPSPEITRIKTEANSSPQPDSSGSKQTSPAFVFKGPNLSKANSSSVLSAEDDKSKIAIKLAGKLRQGNNPLEAAKKKEFRPPPATLKQPAFLSRSKKLQTLRKEEEKKGAEQEKKESEKSEPDAAMSNAIARTLDMFLSTQSGAKNKVDEVQESEMKEIGIDPHSNSSPVAQLAPPPLPANSNKPSQPMASSNVSGLYDIFYGRNKAASLAKQAVSQDVNKADKGTKDGDMNKNDGKSGGQVENIPLPTAEKTPVVEKAAEEQKTDADADSIDMSLMDMGDFEILDECEAD